MPPRYHRRRATAAIAFVFIVVVVVAAAALSHCHRRMPPPRYRHCRCRAARCHCPTTTLPATAALPPLLPRRRRRHPAGKLLLPLLPTRCHCASHRNAAADDTALPVSSSVSREERWCSRHMAVFCAPDLSLRLCSMYLFYLSPLPGGRARPRPSKGRRTLRPPLIKTLYCTKTFFMFFHFCGRFCTKK
jgi:hypothetical protein